MQELDKHIQQLRREFCAASLNESEIESLPWKQMEKWLGDAVKSKANEPNACVLSTCGKNGRPSGRVVLLRDFSENRYGLFTNYNSRKGKELEENHFASLTFFWPELERQVRIEGRVEKHSAEASDKYFYSRPRNSRIGAWSSPQSSPLKDRNELEHLVTEFDKKYPTEDVPRPAFWGGYILIADYYEFWQGRPSRLHDRITYTLKNNNWHIQRIAP